MKLPIATFFSFWIFAATSASACIPTEELNVSRSDVQTMTLFYSTVRKESIRMALTLSPETHRPVFNLVSCVEPRSFNIENADVWDPRWCTPISPVWMPLVSTEEAGNALAQDLTSTIQLYLRENYNQQPIDIVIDAGFDNFGTLLNVGLGFSMSYYAKKYTPKTVLGRYTRRLTRWTGLGLAMGSGVAVVLDLSHPTTRDFRTRKLIELSELIDAIDQEIILQWDGNDKPRQQSASLSAMVDVFKKATRQVFQRHCSPMVTLED